ncbi:NADP-dependent oxidoreductase [Parafrankia sp. EUN1f]|uniref:NADP-dependent oxidoreductase n=1 Tax=Parafrankia sp. EUN1f TaxID=102897 RepID=UPI001E31EDF0|nr:NADP-dependent oxidoreductase [Parafrankia sp. EUN1f]
MTTTMRAVVADDYGPVEGLEVRSLPVPLPGPGQIQVRVRASTLNPAEVRVLDGSMRDLAPLSFPHVVGRDFAGVVTETGDGVRRFAVGDEVFGFGFPETMANLAVMVGSPPSLATGTLAEYAVFEADTPGLALRPAGLTAEHASTLPTAGLTALALVRAGEFQPGDVVAVIGATGGVGSVLLPLLSTAKVHVIATASPVDDGYVRDLGAAEVIDHRAVDVVDEILRRHPDGVDAVVNLALPGDGLAGAATAIRPGGRLLNIVFPTPDTAAFKGRDLTVATVITSARPGDLDLLAARALDGSLPVAISRRYPLTDGVRACVEFLNEHTRGKVVVVAEDETGRPAVAFARAE